MRNSHRLISLVITLGLLTALAAFAAHGFWPDPLTACENHKGLQRTLKALEKDGFELISIEEVPILYIVPPVGNFDWGDVIHTLAQPQQGASGMDYVIVTAEVWYYDESNPAHGQPPGRSGFMVTRVFTEEISTE